MPDLDERRRKLLATKFGQLLDWEPPDIRRTVGPFDPSVFSGFNTKRLELIADCTKRLRQFDDTEINQIIDRRGDDPDNPLREWLSFRRDDIDRLHKSVPAWFDGGFGHPDFAADFENWCKMPSFSVAEALSLSIGIEPGHFQKKRLDAMSKGAFHGLPSALRFLIMRYEQLNRRFNTHQIGDRVRPEKLLAWSDQVEFELHPRFRELLTRFHPCDSNDEASPAQKNRTDKREVDKVAQLFAAMAIDTYGYDPSAARSPIPKEICDLAASMGLSVSDDTVRKYLKRGSSFIPEDWRSE